MPGQDDNEIKLRVTLDHSDLPKSAKEAEAEVRQMQGNVVREGGRAAKSAFADFPSAARMSVDQARQIFGAGFDDLVRRAKVGNEAVISSFVQAQNRLKEGLGVPPDIIRRTEADGQKLADSIVKPLGDVQKKFKEQFGYLPEIVKQETAEIKTVEDKAAKERLAALEEQGRAMRRAKEQEINAEERAEREAVEAKKERARRFDEFLKRRAVEKPAQDPAAQRAADQTAKQAAREAERNETYLRNLKINSFKMQDRAAADSARNQLAAFRNSVQQAKAESESLGGLTRVAISRFAPGGSLVSAGIGDLTRMNSSVKEARAALRAVDPEFANFLRRFRSLTTDSEKAALAQERFGGNVEKLLPRLTGASNKLTELEQAASSASGGGPGGGGGIAGLITTASGAAAAIGVALYLALVAAAVVLFKMAVAAAEVGDKFYHLSENTGYAASTLSALDIAAQKNESSIDKLSGALSTFDRNLDKAKTGHDLTSQAIRRMGLDLNDNERALRQSFRILSQTTDGQDRLRKATLLFGSDARDVLAVVKETGGNLDQYKQKMQELGLLMTGDQARAAHEFKEQLRDVSLQLDAVKFDVGMAAMPIFLDMLKELATWLKQNKQAIVDSISAIAQAINWLVIKPLQGWIMAFGKLADAVRIVRAVRAPKETTAGRITEIATQAGTLAAEQQGIHDVNMEHEETELERLQKEYRKLTDEIRSLQAVGSEEFKLRFKVEDLRRFKADLDRILVLRHELGMPLDLPLPRNAENARQDIEYLERRKRLSEEVKKVADQQREAEDKLAVASVAAQLKVVDAYTRAQTAYLEGVRKRADAEQQLTADIAGEIRKRAEAQANAQADFNRAEAEAVLDQLRQIEAARGAAMRAVIDNRIAGAGISGVRNNPQLAEAQNLARQLAAPRTPVTERLDTSNKILAAIDANTRSLGRELKDAASLIKQAAEQAAGVASEDIQGGAASLRPSPAAAAAVHAATDQLVASINSETSQRLVSRQDISVADLFGVPNNLQLQSLIAGQRTTTYRVPSPDNNPFSLDPQTFKEVTELAGRYVVTLDELGAATDILTERTRAQQDVLKEAARIEFEGREQNLREAVKTLSVTDTLAAKRRVEVTNVIELRRQRALLAALGDRGSFEYAATLSDAALARLKRQVDLTRELIELRYQSRSGFATATREGFQEGERNLLRSREDMAHRSGELAYEILHANEDSAERIRLVQLETIRDIQRADEDAAASRIRSQILIADQTEIHTARAQARVLEFMAQQKGLTDIIADANIGVIQLTYDLIDRGLSSALKNLGPLGSLLKQIISDLAKLAVNWVFRQLMGLGGGGNAGGSQQGGGGGGGILGGVLNAIFGGGRGATGAPLPGIGPGGTAPFNPSGGAGIGFTLPNGQTFSLDNLSSGQFLNPLAFGQSETLTGQTAQRNTIQDILGQTAATQAAGQGGGGILAGLSAAAPLLGLTLGASFGAKLGGPSKLASVLGSIGLGAVGLVLGTGISAGLLTGAAALTAAGWATLGIGAALAIGAYFLGRAKQRKRDESARDALFSGPSGIIPAIDQLIKDVTAHRRDGADAVQNALALRAQYVDAVSQIKTKSVRQSALNNQLPVVDQRIAKLREAANQYYQDKQRDELLVPEFATGLFEGVVPGPVGRPTLILAHGGERVLTIAQQRQYGVGQTGIVTGSREQSQGQAAMMHFDIYLRLEHGKEYASKIAVEGIKSTGGQEAITASVNLAISNNEIG